MELGKRKRRRSDLDVDIDMVPVMNMFLVLIPFLLMSSSFLHLKAINTSVPVRAENIAQATLDKKTDIKITAIVQITAKGIQLSASSNELEAEQLEALGSDFKNKTKGEFELQQLTLALQAIKQKYPKSDTVILVPAQSIKYDTIVNAMDAARSSKDQQLFENVVLSGKVS